MADLGISVPVSAVFPDVGSDLATFRTLVSSLSRTETLFLCARLNLILSNSANPNEIGKQEYAMHTFLTQEEMERINRFASQNGGAKRVTVVRRSQLLELIRWTCLLADDHPDDGSTFEDTAVRRRFAKAALIASDIVGNRNYEDRLLLTGDLAADRRRATPAFRQGASLDTQVTDLAATLARGSTIYRGVFRQRLKGAEKAFLSATGITLDQYLACVCLIMVHYVYITTEGAVQNGGEFNIKTFHRGLVPEMASVLDKYIALESQTADELRDALWKNPGSSEDLAELETFDLKPLRERPILVTRDGRAIILDPVFYGDRSSPGPLFILAGILGKAAFTAFGYAFESYVCDIFRAMYPPPDHLVDRLSCNVRDRTSDGEIADVCLNDATNVVLCEVKASFMPDSSLGDNADTYFAELRKKYCETTDNTGKQSVKGVGQLARSVRLLATGRLTGLDQDFRLARCIYPVLLVHDCTLNSPGHAEFFANEFAQALNPDHSFAHGYMEKGRFSIAPLTLMTIEDLENLQSSIETFGLVEFLRDYCNATSQGSQLSLRDFMTSSDGKYGFIYGKDIAIRAMKVLEETSRLVFPDGARLV